MEDQEGGNDLSSWRLADLISIQMALRAAVELNVFNIIANVGLDAQLSAAEIASKIPTSNPKAAVNLERILRVLGVNSILSMSPWPSQNGDERAYGLTKVSRSLVTSHNQVSNAPMLLCFTEREIVESLRMLKNVVLEPECIPFDKIHGVNFYDYMENEPRLLRLFNETMATTAEVILDEMLKEYAGFKEVKELLDVGGGNGASLKKIISVYPHIHGINFDLPHVIDDATKLPGVEYIGGDMFETLPNTQTIFLKWILHNWDDDQCKKLLRNCWEALPKNGKVIAVDLVLESNADIRNTVMVDLHMMVFHGSKERTTAEFDDLGKAVGFVETKIFPIAHGFYVIEFLK